MSSNKRLDVMLLLLKGLYPVSLVYPNDRDAFDLTTDVMRHQLDTIKIQEFLFVNNPTDNEKVQVQSAIDAAALAVENEKQLKYRFESLL